MPASSGAQGPGAHVAHVAPDAPDATDAPNVPDAPDPRIEAALARYWRRNVAVMTVLILLWAAGGLGCGVLLADRLNEVSLWGFPLGFWFAQQGSIVLFVLIVLAYAVILNSLDRRHHEEVARIGREGDGAGSRADR